MRNESIGTNNAGRLKSVDDLCSECRKLP